MNKTARPPSVYVDANPFIYFVEGDDAVASYLKPFFELVRREPGTAVTSELTLAEVLPKARPDFRRSYLNLMVRSDLFHLHPVTREILIDSADYRRNTARTLADGRSIMTKLPDAIHIVTAVRSGCRAMLSADGGLKVPIGMAIFEPNESGIAKLIQAIA
jgi:predicted nucleic acid-binding protein